MKHAYVMLHYEYANNLPILDNKFFLLLLYTTKIHHLIQSSITSTDLRCSETLLIINE